MLTCLPAGLCSWNYHVSGGNLGNAFLAIDWLTEQGSIHVNHVEYAIRKHGALSGHWSMYQAGRLVAEAHKPSALFRSFQLTGFMNTFTLKAQSPFSRVFELLDGTACVGRMEPVHAFTRRASLRVNAPVHELLQLFAIWLVVITWRRQAASDSGST
jgi:hypothetical protein